MTLWLTSLLVLAMAQPSPDETAIRSARDRFNRAIAGHDRSTLTDDWDPTIRVITSRGAAVQGRDAYRALFEGQFGSLPDIVYIRTTERVVILPDGNHASETGRWEGRWTAADGAVKTGGSYLAQWVRSGASWKLLAEAFAADRCEGGAYCRAP